MATLIDERPVEEELDNNEEVVEQVTEEPQVEETPQEQKKSLTSTKESQRLRLYGCIRRLRSY